MSGLASTKEGYQSENSGEIITDTDVWLTVSQAYLDLPISPNDSRSKEEVLGFRHRDLEMVSEYRGVNQEQRHPDTIADRYGVSRPRVEKVFKRFQEAIPELETQVAGNQPAIDLLAELKMSHKSKRQQRRHLGKTALKVSAKTTPTSEESPAVPEDLLDIYFHDLGKRKLLTPEEEVELAQTIESGRDAETRRSQQDYLDVGELEALEQAIAAGQKAFERFAEANLRLVVSIAAKYKNSHRSQLGLDELIQEGNTGLLRAVEKFDWRLGYKFSTYATWWIRQAIQRGVADQDRTIRIPVHRHDDLRKVRAAKAHLESKTGRQPTPEELAEATNQPVDKVLWALESDYSMTSLDYPLGPDDDSQDIGSLMAKEESFEAGVDTQLLTEQVFKKAAEVLDERGWLVLQLRHGLIDGDKWTYEAVGDRLHLSRESIRTIEKKALAKLRQRQDFYQSAREL